MKGPISGLSKETRRRVVIKVVSPLGVAGALYFLYVQHQHQHRVWKVIGAETGLLVTVICSW
jgi:hypothetical protein